MKQLTKKDSPKFINRTGENFINQQGEKFIIIDCDGFSKCTIKFEDNTILYNRLYSKLKIGKAKNPNYPNVYGVGIVGKGSHKCSINGKIYKKYRCWNSILFRCYSEKYHLRQPSYKDVKVCEEWKYYQNFAEWFEKNYNPEIMQDWHLDKDILIKGNKIYSPETCCFVPKEINTLFTKNNAKRGKYPIGVIKEGNKYRAQLLLNNKRYIGIFNTIEEAFQAYKVAKEKYIKEVADKWKGLISDEVYQALYKYQVEMYD